MSSVVNCARLVTKTIHVGASLGPYGDLVIRRVIGGYELKRFDPFLLLEDDVSSDGKAEFPDHPHRGVEIVNYVLEGAWKYEDFGGHKGTLEAGDLQWMTAGRGIVHSEVGDQSRGKSHGLQLWVNLSSQNKMIEPRYQELKSRDIPEVVKDGVKVRVIAGEAFGIKSPIYTLTPTMYLDFTLDPGSHLQKPIPSKWNAFVYLLEGEGVFGNLKSSPEKSYSVLLLGSGDSLEAWNKSSNKVKFLLIAGQPLNEPVVQHGPFVMNTREEIERTFHDYYGFTNGFERARTWRSEHSQGFSN
ncbi:transcription cofactor [Lithospermum erythrorhizon]|uniref:Transcription cofactor n=1 Tax=Lithospermum erythrorhizon TaxID=34254 RepID=A0AAV3NHU6_LITER